MWVYTVCCDITWKCSIQLWSAYLLLFHNKQECSLSTSNTNLESPLKKICTVLLEGTFMHHADASMHCADLLDHVIPSVLPLLMVLSRFMLMQKYYEKRSSRQISPSTSFPCAVADLMKKEDERFISYRKQADSYHAGSVNGKENCR